MVAAIDFKMAFDSTQHEALWNSFRNHSVSENTFCVLKNCALVKRATALTDVESDDSGTLADQLGSPISNGERHWNLERKGLGHQTE